MEYDDENWEFRAVWVTAGAMRSVYFGDFQNLTNFLLFSGEKETPPFQIHVRRKPGWEVLPEQSRDALFEKFKVPAWAIERSNAFSWPPEGCTDAGTLPTLAPTNPGDKTSPEGSAVDYTRAPIVCWRCGMDRLVYKSLRKDYGPVLHWFLYCVRCGAQSHAVTAPDKVLEGVPKPEPVLSGDK